MVPRLTATLRKALQQLNAQRQRLDGQITAIRSLLQEWGDRQARVRSKVRPRPKSKRRRMSAAARRAISRRMKASWAKRKAALAKGTEKKTQKGA